MIFLDDVTCILSSGRLKTTVLQNVTVELPTDEHLVVLAQQGSGKSSLIRLLAGSLMPVSGTIHRYAHVSFPVGYTGGFKRTATVYENLAHAARLYGADVDEVLTFVVAVTGLHHAMKEVYGDLPAQLSRRLAYALSYAIPFDTYLIDDRVAAGDPEFRLRCERIFEERTKNSGYILTTSVPRYAKRYGKRAAILHNGTIALYNNFDKAVRDFEGLERNSLIVRPRSSEVERADDGGESDDG